MENNSQKDQPKHSQRPLTRSRKALLSQQPLTPDHHIRDALETLDNHHALALLSSAPTLSQDLLCLRTQLAHSLGQHSTCTLFASQALLNHPQCRPCLSVYLAHPENIPRKELPLRDSILQAIEQEGSQLQVLLSNLLSRIPVSESFARLMNEVRDRGGDVEKVGILEGSEQRRMLALRQIARNQQVLFVPSEQLITLQLARQLPLVQKLLSAKTPLRSPKHTQLAIFVLLHSEMGPSSPFASYIATLPRSFGHFPLNFGEELLKELRGTCFLEQIESKRHDMQKDYQLVCSVDETFSRFSTNQFLSARLLVSSRVFGIVKEGTKTDALVPVADMLNHRLPKQTSWYYCERSHGFVVQSLREITTGEEVFDSYGLKCNSRFLLNYGFILENNPHNEVALEINLLNSLQGLPRRVKIRVSKCLEHHGFEQLLGILRATLENSQRNQEEQEEQISMGLQGVKQTTFLSRQNEKAVWKTIGEIVVQQLQAYPTSILEDKRILQQCEDRNFRNIVILRKGEKEVLSFYSTMSRKMIRYFESSSRRGDLTLYASYIESIQNKEL